jgi:hypothetical protein
LEDLSFEEGTWEIAAQLYRMGMRVNNLGSTSSYRYSDQSNCVVLDGYLYCFDKGLTGLYKINLSNITDIKFIEHPSKAVEVSSISGGSSAYYIYNGSANLTVSGNKVCLWDGYLNGDGIVECICATGSKAAASSYLNDGWNRTTDLGAYPQRNSAGLHPLKIGAYSLLYQATDLTVYAHLLLVAPYLATINNLPTPVQKTADKTMKITYILREE